jgi:hypothetical protein
MDVKAAIQPILDSLRAQALLAHVTTEESKQTIIADLYDMLPRPVRWVRTPEVFDDYVRRNVFRETPKEGPPAA